MGPARRGRGFAPGRLETFVLKSMFSPRTSAPALHQSRSSSSAEALDRVHKWLSENINGRSGVQCVLLLCNLVALDVFVVAHKLVDEPVGSDFDDTVGDSLRELMIV